MPEYDSESKFAVRTGTSTEKKQGLERAVAISKEVINTTFVESEFTAQQFWEALKDYRCCGIGFDGESGC